MPPSTARTLKMEPTVLAGMLARIAADPRYGRDRGMLLEVSALVRDELIDPEPMTIEEVAAYIGQPKRYIRTLVTDKSIPFHQTREGGHLMFDRREIRAWWHAMSTPAQQRR